MFYVILVIENRKGDVKMAEAMFLTAKEIEMIIKVMEDFDFTGDLTEEEVALLEKLNGSKS
jgi:hypothetical protein